MQSKKKFFIPAQGSKVKSLIFLKKSYRRKTIGYPSYFYFHECNTVNSRYNEFQGTEKKIRYIESSLHRNSLYQENNIPIEFIITRIKIKIQNFIIRIHMYKIYESYKYIHIYCLISI